ncbi:MAG: hypothetical protein LAN59_01400 [Acidobacteriia bacterium]|nr:hypothetical protein [Terriglobia bacterium]
MAGTILDLVLLAVVLMAAVVCAVAPLGFMGFMLWRWHKEMSRVRPARTIRPKAPPRTVSVRPSIPSMPASGPAQLDRLAS